MADHHEEEALNAILIKSIQTIITRFPERLRMRLSTTVADIDEPGRASGYYHFSSIIKNKR